VKQYKDIITLVKNARGCYILDPIKGCSLASKYKGGCYGNCYAQNIASRYGFDFTVPTKRDFIKDTKQIYLQGFCDVEHEADIVRQIKNIDMPFIRMGEMGDPSEDWTHTVDICSKVAMAGKPIVIITKHINKIPDNLLDVISGINVCINTSLSALDTDDEIEHRLVQYEKLKAYSKSILRLVSCDFNLRNKTGQKKDKRQDALLALSPIDTVFRPSLENKLVTSGIIKIKRVKFLRGDVLASMHRPDIYMGICDKCPDMCGINMAVNA